MLSKLFVLLALVCIFFAWSGGSDSWRKHPEYLLQMGLIFAISAITLKK